MKEELSAVSGSSEAVVPPRAVVLEHALLTAVVVSTLLAPSRALQGLRCCHLAAAQQHTATQSLTFLVVIYQDNQTKKSAKFIG